MVPMLEADTAIAAMERARSWSEGRARHWWDGATEISRLYAKTLGLKAPAWDVSVLHSPGIRWEEEMPPAPTFWMHQLSPSVGADPALRLSHDPSRLSHVLDELRARNARTEMT